MAYLTEDEQIEQQIANEVGRGCVLGTLTLLVIIVITIIAMVFSCGHVKEKPGCEAYGNGKVYNKKK